MTVPREGFSGRRDLADLKWFWSRGTEWEERCGQTLKWFGPVRNYSADGPKFASVSVGRPPRKAGHARWPVRRCFTADSPSLVFGCPCNSNRGEWRRRQGLGCQRGRIDAAYHVDFQEGGHVLRLANMAWLRRKRRDPFENTSRGRCPAVGINDKSTYVSQISFYVRSSREVVGNVEKSFHYGFSVAVCQTHMFPHSSAMSPMSQQRLHILSSRLIH